MHQAHNHMLPEDDVQLADLVDTVGQLQKRLDVETERLTRLKAELLAHMRAIGAKRVSGHRHKAVAVHQNRPRVDWKAVAMKLRPSQQLITAHRTITSVDFVSVK